MRISTFGYVGKQGVKNIWRNKMFSLASIATMSACIFLFGLFFSLLVNFQYIIKSAEEGVAITVLFNEDATQEQKDAIGEQLKSRDDVSKVKYVSADDAWAEYQKEYFRDNPELAEGFKDDNPLANSDNYEVYMKTVKGDNKDLIAKSKSLSATQQDLVKFAQSLDGVRKVNKSDVVANTLSSVNMLVAYVSIAIIAILLGVSIILISNTVTTGITVRKEEIAIMKQASVINDKVMERVADFIKEGMTEKEVADFIDAEYLKEGASGVSFDTIVCFGANAADQHHTPSETRTLKAGECVLIDMGCIWNGYCSDMTRTFYCKSVDDEQAAIHDLVRTAVEKAEAVIKPGVRFCDIDAQARDLIDEAGYSEYWRIRLGHFIGQEDHEYGDVSPINKNVAEPGMIFSIEPGIYLEGKYGVRVEDLVLVTEDGHELLNAVDKKYRIVG